VLRAIPNSCMGGHGFLEFHLTFLL
jgi:hypothetical protein